jgi:hypothetical protein
MSTCSSSIGHYRNPSSYRSHRSNRYNRNHRYQQLRKLIKVLSPYLLLIAIFTGSMGWFIWDWQESHKRLDNLAYQPQIVQQGDTLWSLAESSGLPIDTRTLVLKIMEYNQLTDTTIQTGQVIYTPMLSD